ncbi:Dihydrofolate reductase [hydrothermal vent metagenome]|uniref:dihydrofolate reductase n=1 Tax=hydrothermal vent metagenome TaxID=652676 RepID=A0A3B1A7Y9_9ZZZZ
MAILSLIAAMASNRVIGINNTLPWHLPADFKHFKAVTMGKPILMGRKTYESIGRPLPGRKNIIITHNTSYSAQGCIVVNSIDEALAQTKDDAEVMVIGGASFYQQTLPIAQRIYLTIIHHEFEGDTHFIELDNTTWKEIDRLDYEPDEKNSYPYSFLTLERQP